MFEPNNSLRLDLPGKEEYVEDPYGQCVKLGIGTYTNVYLVQNVAVKVYTDNYHLWSKEIQILSTLNDLNCPNLVAICPGRSEIKPSYRTIVTETCFNGDMYYFVKAEKFSEALARTFFKQLHNAVSCCHRVGVYHRDIKLENILLSEDNVLKLADFGTALQSPVVSEDPMSTSRVGTLRYFSQEVYNVNPISGYKCSKADVWMMGIVCFSMLTGSGKINLFFLVSLSFVFQIFINDTHFYLFINNIY
jgi:serine/threonine protein kinase